ncbi:MAG: membrane lipoprotein lipid attachment site-containing protein [bacterium]
MKRSISTFVFLLILSGCSSDKFILATRLLPRAEYRILAVHDSDLVAVPWIYDDHINPFVIEHFAKRIRFDSITFLHQGESSGKGEAYAGAAIGYVPGIVAGSLLSPDANHLWPLSLGMLVGPGVGALIGYFLRSNERDMLPIYPNLRDIKFTAYYSYYEPPELKNLK